MKTLEQIYEEFKAPFPIRDLYFRVGATNARSNGGVATKGVALAYVDARAVMKRLDDVVGWDGWQDSYEETTSGRVICTLMVRVILPDVGGKSISDYIGKSDGAGATDMEGEKGAISDAFKRAAVKFGIGRYLYYLDAPWVELENGRIKDTNQLIQRLPKWAIPSEEK